MLGAKHTRTVIVLLAQILLKLFKFIAQRLHQVHRALLHARFYWYTVHVNDGYRSTRSFACRTSRSL